MLKESHDEGGITWPGRNHVTREVDSISMSSALKVSGLPGPHLKVLSWLGPTHDFHPDQAFQPGLPLAYRLFRTCHFSRSCWKLALPTPGSWLIPWRSIQHPQDQPLATCSGWWVDKPTLVLVYIWFSSCSVTLHIAPLFQPARSFSVSLPDSPQHSFKNFSLIFNSVPRHWSTLSHFLFLQPRKVITVTSIFIQYREKL